MSEIAEPGLPSAEKNVASLLTPRGAGALAVVRLAGPGVRDWLARRFSKPLACSRTVHGELRDLAGDVIDDPVVVLHEDDRCADISLHGGAWVVQATLKLLQCDGFEIIDDPVIRESADRVEQAVLRSIPLATTELGLQSLLAQTEAWRSLLNAYDTTWCEIFAAAPAPQLHPALRCALHEIAKDRALWWLLHPPTVAIVGAPNVGKSTLANRLLGQERSIVADLPGTTRDWVGEQADLEGLPILLADTPGIRQTNDPIEHRAIQQSADVVGNADLVVLMLDATVPLERQRELIQRFPAALRLVNKIDLPRALDLAEAQAIAISATRGEGIDRLIEQILRHFAVFRLDRAQPRWWTRQQREIVTNLAAAI